MRNNRPIKKNRRLGKYTKKISEGLKKLYPNFLKSQNQPLETPQEKIQYLRRQEFLMHSKKSNNSSLAKASSLFKSLSNNSKEQIQKALGVEKFLEINKRIKAYNETKNYRFPTRSKKEYFTKEGINSKAANSREKMMKSLQKALQEARESTTA